MRAQGTFTIQSWDEQRYEEVPNGGRLTRAAVKQAFSGDFEGDGAVQWLMCHRPDETAEFVGIQSFSGQIGGLSGSVVLVQTDGTFDGGLATGRLAVVPGSGTGELSGLRGEGEFTAPHGSPASITLDYELE